MKSNLSKLSKLSNLSNNKFIKIILVTLVIVLSIYLLYFNDKKFITDPSNLNCEDPIVENFNVAKYVDICKNRKTNFYEFSGMLEIFKDTPNCELKCDKNECDAFIINGNDCNLYNGNLNKKGIDTNTVSVDVNCESNILPEDKAGKYNGYGYINKKYFKDNKSKFRYKDTYLDEATKIRVDLVNLKKDRDALKRLPTNTESDITKYNIERGVIDNKYTAILDKFNTNKNLFDNEQNILFTDMLGYSDDHVLIPEERTMDFINDINDKDKTTKDSYNLDSKLGSIEKNYNSMYIQYILLAFIMVITIILLILYKFSNYVINEKILMLYIIFITFTLLFLNHYIKYIYDFITNFSVNDYAQKYSLI